MKVNEILCDYEVVYISDNGEILEENVIRAYKRYGNTFVKKYRCLAGKRKGKLVSHPGGCSIRKDPKRVRIGRKVMRAKKGMIQLKSKIAKRKSISKLIARRNKSLRGNK